MELALIQKNYLNQEKEKWDCIKKNSWQHLNTIIKTETEYYASILISPGFFAN